MKTLLSLEWAKWVVSVGGISVATRMIVERLGCSSSKAEKLAARRYMRRLSGKEELALAELLGKPREVVFRDRGVA